MLHATNTRRSPTRFRHPSPDFAGSSEGADPIVTREGAGINGIGAALHTA
jgi:hypothetical protein